MTLETPSLDLGFGDHIRVNYWYGLRTLRKYLALFAAAYLLESVAQLLESGSAAAFVPNHYLIVFAGVFLTYFFLIQPLIYLIWMKLRGRMATKLWLSLTDEEFCWRTEFIRIGLPWHRVRKFVEQGDGFYLVFSLRGGLRIPKRQLDQETIRAIRDYVTTRIAANAK